MDKLDSIPLEQLQSYYSNFTLTTESLTRHSHKLEFWKKMISSSLSEDSLFVLNSSTCQEKFTHKGLRPLCFPSLLSQWEKDKTIIPVEDFCVKSSLYSLGLGFFTAYLGLSSQNTKKG